MMDTTIEDIAELLSINKCVARAHSITKFIYNHHQVHSLIQKYINSEILRLRVTRFVTNFIALKLLQQKRQGLNAMVTSREWFDSRYSRLSNRKKIKKIILSSRFWEIIIEIIKVVKPLCVILRKVDIYKYPHMPYLKYMMVTTREEVKKIFKDDFKTD
ncbi:hypothetical protein GW17_00011013 [Ensete ventricosum]|nr:hypothetical protein GW17_00011013 [Ensete ventricosum]